MILILFTFALFATAILANKIILYTMAPMLYLAIRMSLSGATLVGISAYKNDYMSFEQLKQDFFIIVGMMLCTTYLPPLLKAYALQDMHVSKAAFLGSLDPLVTPFFSYFFFGERLTKNKLIGILLGVFGAMILLVAHAPDDALKVFGVFSYPELAALGSMLISRFGWILVQKFLREHRYTPLSINTVMMLMSGIVCFVTAYVTRVMHIGTLATASYPILKHLPLSVFSAPIQLVVFILWSVFFGSVIGYTFYAYVLKKYSQNLIALLGLSIPLNLHFLGWLLLDEPLTMSFFVAFFFMLAGFLLFFRDEKHSYKAAA